jgi:D-glycero-D-manno-heptose 1,7-bisphosphate phosphatase
VKPLFLDRDGVLNVDVKPYVTHRSHFELFPWTVPALNLLFDAGFDLFVISNQQGVAKGITLPAELEACTEALRRAIAPKAFRKIYYCLALDAEDHPWRKPNPGMILAAGQEFGFDPGGSFVVGDKWSDAECAARAGCRSLIVQSGLTKSFEETREWAHPPEAVFPTLLEAAEWLARGELQ